MVDQNIAKRTLFSSRPMLEDMRVMMKRFVEEREWQKFHTPRNLLLALIGEVGELAEIFQWKGDKDIDTELSGFSSKEKEHLGEEMSDVLLYLVRLADQCNLDLTEAAACKLKVNETKYPATLVKGLCKKHTEYTSYMRKVNGEVLEETFVLTHDYSERTGFSVEPSLEELRVMLDEFSEKRDWRQFHTPRNLVLTLSAEVGELSELFQWENKVQTGLLGWSNTKRSRVGEELSDILLNLIRLSDVCDVDLPSVVMRKFTLNTQKYPKDLVRGSSKKYTHYKTNEL